MGYSKSESKTKFSAEIVMVGAYKTYVGVAKVWHGNQCVWTQLAAYNRLTRVEAIQDAKMLL